MRGGPSPALSGHASMGGPSPAHPGFGGPSPAHIGGPRSPSAQLLGGPPGMGGSPSMGSGPPGSTSNMGGGPPGMGGPPGSMGPGPAGMGGGPPGIGGVPPGMGGGPPGMGGPGPMGRDTVYPPDQPMIFNPQNPSAPPIYPCGICRKEVHENDQALLCESGCNFWFHRICTGIEQAAFHFLTQEIYAEWVCDSCFQSKTFNWSSSNRKSL